VTAARPELLERLAELSLVEIDTLIGRLPDDVAASVIAAYVADLEDALGEARTVLREAQREHTAGTDPLALLDVGAERRARGGEPAFADAAARLGQRATERRDLARLEEAVRGVLPRLLEADRRLMAIA
jgi:hypothetical protein